MFWNTKLVTRDRKKATWCPLQKTFLLHWNLKTESTSAYFTVILVDISLAIFNLSNRLLTSCFKLNCRYSRCRPKERKPSITSLQNLSSSSLFSKWVSPKIFFFPSRINDTRTQMWVHTLKHFSSLLVRNKVNNSRLLILANSNIHVCKILLPFPPILLSSSSFSKPFQCPCLDILNSAG